MGDIYDPKWKADRPKRRLTDPTTWAVSICAALLLVILIFRRPQETEPRRPRALVPAAPARTLTERLQERAMRVVPTYRGPGRIEVFPPFANANRVLLATHNRLLWYRFDTGETQVVHEGQVQTPARPAPPRPASRPPA
jgi:hypothetical protein